MWAGSGQAGGVSVGQVSDFFAVLALGSLLIGCCGVGAALAPGAAARARQLRPVLLPLALVIASVATAGSLYYSEVAGYPPCEMCWYQRICMYALVPVLAVALARRDRGGAWYGLPLALAGLGLSVYHYQLQLFPDQGSTCDVAAPCTYQWVDSFGFVSIPFMAGTGFIGVAGLLLLSLRSGR
ncbi:MAG: disulfide bond formation protein B [Acidimicrobiaceae bacterium]|nr:disulfide bond formation protein B [Acidimicrobiaceae bacterium]MYF43849.1 disulfide bond formation protein B [Acidimicrobiaceae bacterium]